jgi:hypothetical protein
LAQLNPQLRQAAGYLQAAEVKSNNDGYIEKYKKSITFAAQHIVSKGIWN